MDVADRRGRLSALLDVLTEALAESPPYARAALAREIRATMTELASLPEPKRNPLHDIAAERASRRANSKVPKSA